MTQLLSRPRSARSARGSRAGRSGAGSFDAMLAAARPALDAILENVMIADLDLTLRYVNPAALRTLHTIAADVQAAFGLSIDELAGGSIHRFHRDPARVERILAESDGFTLPHLAEFGFGTVMLSTKIASFENPASERVGYLVSWANVTDLREAERQKSVLVERLTSAAAAVEELNASIGSIAQGAHETADLATRSARQTRVLADEVVRLDTQSAEIHSAIASINAVAQQTKLLALNATIEAARAGEAGKGFAVVAGEVKDLAGTTAAVTAEIGANLTAITELVAQVRTAIEEVGQQIGDIEVHQTSIAGAVEEQGAVSRELAVSIAEAGRNL